MLDQIIQFSIKNKLIIGFNDKVDIYWARQQISERLQQVQSEIPAEIGLPAMAPVTTGLGEIYQYVVRAKPGFEQKFNLRELRTIQDWIVRRQLLGTPGVADVSTFGGELKQYEVAVMPDKLKSFGLTITDVFHALENNNQNAGIAIGQAETKPISATLKLNGSIDVPPQSMVSISFPLGGYLKSSKLLPGMQVRKGEVLAIMEDAQIIQLQQDYLLAKAKLELLEGEFLRQQRLNAGKASSDKIFQQAKTDFETQKIMLRALGEKLRLIGLSPENLSENSLSRSVSVRSPINGSVAKRAATDYASD